MGPRSPGTATLPRAMALRRPSLLIVFVLFAAACSGGSEVTATTTTTTSTTTSTTTTTLATTTTTSTLPTTTTTLDPTLVTIAPEGFRSPVDGAATDGSGDRRAIAVKVDNHPEARPQSGLQEADAVVEILVEGGLTRFIAVFHLSDSAHVGPVRSMRPTDTTLLPLIGPMAMSGAQPWVLALAASRGTRLIGETVGSGLFRIATRVAPHNLYGDTTRLRATSDARSFPNTSPLWLYRLGEWRIPETRATTVELSWSGQQQVTWRYEDGRYTRWYGDTPHRWRAADGTTGQVTADVLVILAGRRHTARAPADGGSDVPAIETLGSGEAWVISRGGVWNGRWQRDAISDQFVLLEPDGTEAVVPPGFVWVSIFPEQRSVTITGD